MRVAILILLTIGWTADAISQSAAADPATDLMSLEEKLKTGSVKERSKAVTALSKLGEVAAKTLGRVALIDSDEGIREEALGGLAQLGPFAEPAIPELIECLKDTERSDRFLPCICFWRIGPPASKAVGVLTELASEKSSVRGLQGAAVNALGSIGEFPEPVIAALTAALASKDLSLIHI